MPLPRFRRVRAGYNRPPSAREENRKSSALENAARIAPGYRESWSPYGGMAGDAAWQPDRLTAVVTSGPDATGQYLCAELFETTPGTWIQTADSRLNVPAYEKRRATVQVGALVELTLNPRLDFYDFVGGWTGTFQVCLNGNAATVTVKNGIIVSVQ